MPIARRPGRFHRRFWGSRIRRNGQPARRPALWSRPGRALAVSWSSRAYAVAVMGRSAAAACRRIHGMCQPPRRRMMSRSIGLPLGSVRRIGVVVRGLAGGGLGAGSRRPAAAPAARAAGSGTRAAGMWVDRGGRRCDRQPARVVDPVRAGAVDDRRPISLRDQRPPPPDRCRHHAGSQSATSCSPSTAIPTSTRARPSSTPTGDRPRSISRRLVQRRRADRKPPSRQRLGSAVRPGIADRDRRDRHRDGGHARREPGRAGRAGRGGCSGAGAPDGG